MPRGAENSKVAKMHRSNLRLGFKVKARNELCLTDFLESAFAGKFAKNRDFCGGEK
jgi:hypothetical protein